MLPLESESLERLLCKAETLGRLASSSLPLVVPMRSFVTGGLVLEAFGRLGDAGEVEPSVEGRLRSGERFLSSIEVENKLLRRPKEAFGAFDEEPAE